MITILIGHRGAGKTSLLERIRSYLPIAETIDLDRHIEMKEGRAISDIFQIQGEKKFREIERRTFAEILVGHEGKETPLYVAVGAGFEWKPTHGVRCLWVRRPTDHSGRILLDRPRLDSKKSQLESYRERFLEREQRYDEMSYEELTVPEGFFSPNETEKSFFTDAYENIGGVLTLLPKHFSHSYTWYWYIGRRLAWGIDAFEVRDDLLTKENIERVYESIPTGKTLLSYRTTDASKRIEPKLGIRWDWDISLGESPYGIPPILSSHGPHAIEQLEAVDNGKSFLKAAPEISTFSELLAGHRWMIKDSERRIFLPRSSDGRWTWYRSLMKGRMHLNFFREGLGSSPDQPFLLDWIRTPRSPKYFAAVVGDPVLHSFTPAEQWNFFAKKNLPVFAIRITEEEWKEGALEILHELGLRYAAVTSPLKTLAGSRNTLVWDEKKKEWPGANTDLAGLEMMSKKLSEYKSVVVWGGGGMLSALEKIFPHAIFYAARTGKPRKGNDVSDVDLLIWAGSADGVRPPASWKPKQVFDLNYRQDSPALDFAEQKGVPYTSGLDFFREQAKAQREFWGRCHCEE